MNNQPNLEMAPRRKKSQSVSSFPTRPAIRRRRTSAFLSCSKTVYCSTGFTTRTSAGLRPRKNAANPPVRMSRAAVARRPRRLGGCAETSAETESIPFTVCAVWITQTGLEMTVVAEAMNYFFAQLRKGDTGRTKRRANQRSAQQTWIRGWRELDRHSGIE